MSDDVTRRAADVLQGEQDQPRHRWDEAGEPYGWAEQMARALHEAGLLAPDMREEWGVQWDDGHLWDHYLNREEAQAGAGDGSDPTDGTVVHRHVTDWETP